MNNKFYLIISFIWHILVIIVKKYEVSKQWVKILCEEFWIQGEKEKCLGKPVSFLFDRDKIDLPASQVYFFKEFIISIVLTVLLKNFLYYNTHA